MVEKIYILRHGFRLNWVTTNWKSVTGLPRDPPLAALGETQAKEVAEFFLSLPESERPTAIFSSPYYRCIQTLLPVSQALKIPIYVEHGLAEWYSPVAPNTGLHPRPGPASSLLEFHPPGSIDPDGWKSIHYPSRKGETIAQIHDRIEEFLNDFIPLRPNTERVLFCSHAAPIAAMVHVSKAIEILGLGLDVVPSPSFLDRARAGSRSKSLMGSIWKGALSASGVSKMSKRTKGRLCMTKASPGLREM
ncbi:histidine phosphatase superfamily [Mucidula mucida]|nr:histidine phosphatase superfamily [Mucidula mucida]